MLSLWRRLFPPPGRFELVPGVPLGFIPRRKTSGSAGYDLSVYLPEPAADMVLEPGARCRLRVGVRLVLHPGWQAHIYDRSSWRLRGLSMLGVGVIDSDYPDELGVIVMNLGTEPQRIVHGDACGQLIFARVHTLGDTVQTPRVGGFGSTDPRPPQVRLPADVAPERWPERVKLDLSPPRIAPTLERAGAGGVQ